MAACCYFGSDLGIGLDHNFPSQLTDGTPHSSSDLLYFTPFLPFTLLDKNFLSRFLLPSSLRTKVKIPSLICSSGSKNSKSHSKFAKKNSKSNLLSHFEKNSHFLLTHSILLPLESKQCPLMPASVLACADSVDKLRFRN